jgi:hypothetical protein
MELDQTTSDAQAQAGTVLLLYKIMIGTEELFLQVDHILGGHANARITDADAYMTRRYRRPTLPTDNNPNGAPIGRVQVGIADQMAEDLDQALSISKNGR